MALEWDRMIVEEDLGVIEVHDEGRPMHGLNVATTKRGVEKIRLGYKCINCMEPFESAWPKKCPLCGYPVADKQAEEFARVYKEYDKSRFETDWDAELDRIEERKARRAFENRTGISVVVGKSLKKVFR